MSNTQLSPVFGLITNFNSNTTLKVTAGNCFDIFNTVDLILSSDTNINAAINGINGLDTGSLAASTFYASYIIGSQDNIQPVGLILSTDFDIPLLPSNYNTYRRIGIALTNGSSHFINLVPSNNILQGTNLRTYRYSSPISVLSAGSSTSYAPIDLTGKVPSIDSLLVGFFTTYTPNSGGNFFSIINGTQTSGFPSQIASTANVPMSSFVYFSESLVMGAPTVQYLVQTGDSLDVSVSSFQDVI